MWGQVKETTRWAEWSLLSSAGSWSGLLEWWSNYHYNDNLCMWLVGILRCRLEKDVVPIIVFIVIKHFWNWLLVHNQNIRYFAFPPLTHLLSLFPINRKFLEAALSSLMNAHLQRVFTHTPAGCTALRHSHFLTASVCPATGGCCPGTNSAVCCCASRGCEVVWLFCWELLRTCIRWTCFAAGTVGSVTSSCLVVINSWSRSIVCHIATFRHWLTSCWAWVKMVYKLSTDLAVSHIDLALFTWVSAFQLVKC